MKNNILVVFIILFLIGCDGFSKVPKEKYYRGDMVLLNIGVKASVFDKVYKNVDPMHTQTGPKFWIYKVNVGGGPQGVSQIEVREDEIEKCLKESASRPQAEKTQ